MIDGPGRIGKTTIGTLFGRRYELSAARAWRRVRVPRTTSFRSPTSPVPSGATIKGLNETILDYFGQPLSRTTTRDRMTRSILKIARRCRTRLVIIDDIHFLAVRSQPAARDVNNHLKYLANTSRSRRSSTLGIGLRDDRTIRRGRHRRGRNPITDAKAFQTTAHRTVRH